jgi:hypothetical protein
MLKFFRKIRQNLLSEGNTGKYLKYAVGEIILVVIGILIALTINNLNEESKKDKLKDGYIKSFQSDLEADVILLEKQLAGFEQLLKADLELSRRLSSPNANSDTLIKIARFEFTPYFDPTNELNLNTFNAMISTGNLDLLDRDFAKKIQEHNAFQLTTLKLVDFNMKICSDVGKTYIQTYPLNSPFNAINGETMDSFWDEANENQLKIDLNAALTSKIFVAKLVNSGRTTLLERTKILIAEIDKILVED